MQAVFNGQVIASSDDTAVVEENHYFPLDSVRPEVLRASRMKSLCPWKGVASYYTVQAGGVTGRDAAWTYRHPSPMARRIKNRVAFWGPVQVVDNT